MSFLWTPWTHTLLVMAVLFVVLAAAYSFLKYEMLMREARRGSADLPPEESFRLRVARRLGIGAPGGNEFCVLLIEPGGADPLPPETLQSLAGAMRAGARRSDDVAVYDGRTIGAVLDLAPAHWPKAMARWRATWSAAAAAAGVPPATVSGYARHPLDATSAESLVTAARRALDRARADGPSDFRPSCAGGEDPTDPAAGPAHPSEADLVDALTGILRPERMAAAARKFLARGHRLGHPVTVLHVDVDRLQEINAMFGRETGDEVLRTMGGILSGGLRETDLVGRAGGDDFLALVECGVEDAAKAAERILAGVRAAAIRSDLATVRFTVSIGLAGATEEGTPRHVLRAAETAMLAARRMGRNAHAVYRRDMDAVVAEPDEERDVF